MSGEDLAQGDRIQDGCVKEKVRFTTAHPRPAVAKEHEKFRHKTQQKKRKEEKKKRLTKKSITFPTT